MPKGSFKLIERGSKALEEIAKIDEKQMLEIVEQAHVITAAIAPRDVPFLALNIDVEKVGGFTWILFTTTGYGKHQEFGTTKTVAQPYIQPGVNQAFENVRNGTSGLGEVASLQGRGKNRGLKRKRKPTK